MRHKKSKTPVNWKPAEVRISYTPPSHPVKIKDAYAAYQLFKLLWDHDLFYARSEYYAVFLNEADEVLCYGRVGHVGRSYNFVNTKEILCMALKTLCAKVIVAKNDLSKKLEPSTAEDDLHLSLQETLRFLDIEIEDYLIITESLYYSIKQERMFYSEL